MTAAILIWLAALGIACLGLPVSESRYWRLSMPLVAVGVVVYLSGWLVYASAVAS